MSAWLWFPGFAAAAVGCWLAGLGLRGVGRVRAGTVVYVAGVAVLGLYVVLLWLHLERPPLRTLGETRLWYAFLLPALACLLTLRWRIGWPLAYAAGMAGIFLLINVIRPGTFDKALMPALQSPWFVPHVVVYLLAYAFMTASAFGGLRFFLGKPESLAACDRAVWIGLALLTLGLLFGALWAKEAWGHYWTWDPKETWAFLTWAVYLAYIHIRIRYPQGTRFAAGFLLAAVLVLGTCWFGVNYLPSTNTSVHTYSKSKS